MRIAIALLIVLGICGCGKAPAVANDDAAQRQYVSTHECTAMHHYPSKFVWDSVNHSTRTDKPWTMYECKNPDVFLHPDDY